MGSSILKISIITAFPDLYGAFLKTSLVGRAVSEGCVSVSFTRLSDVCAPKERIDAKAVGHGAGMLLRPEVLARAIEQCQQRFGLGLRIFFTPQGEVLSQPFLRQLSGHICSSHDRKERQDTVSPARRHIILVCGRYEGFDERVLAQYADLQISIGDYVLMGGDLPAQVFLEGLLRLIPGVIGNRESVENDSFSGAFLDYPLYGQPKEWEGRSIPSVLLKGDHGKIQQWREQQAAKQTMERRFDWFSAHAYALEDRKRGLAAIPKHYIAFMHDEVLVKAGHVGVTSVTSLDIHDTARLSATYALDRSFIVTPLEDQHMIMNTFLDFWKSDRGRAYNPTRFEAIAKICPTRSLNEAIASVEESEGKKPLLIATSAREIRGAQHIDYYSQGSVWKQDRPVMFVFGTGQGLAAHVTDRCDYILDPIFGLSDYNHLSVRSAIAIILDRWLAVKPRRERAALDKECD